MRLLVLCVPVLLAGVLALSSAEEWSYSGESGPKSWSKHNAACGKKKQSPINVVTSSLKYDQGLGPIVVKGYDNKSPTGTTFTLKNNGHSVQVDVTSPRGQYLVSAKGLSKTYETAQFHLHWGSKNSQGSEHTVDNKAYPMEMHFVSYDKQEANIGVALPKPDGLAVLGVLFEIGSTDNANFKPIFDLLPKIASKGNSTSLPVFALRGLLPADVSAYYRYSGSLTTPPCYQSVQWTIFKQTVKISQKQMDTLRQSVAPSKVVDNFRPIQALNGRQVRTSSTSAAMATGNLQDNTQM